MALTSFSFYIFAAVTVLLYYIFPRKAQWFVLLLASATFYLTYGWEKLPFLLASAAIAYFAGLKMERIQTDFSKNKVEAKRRSKRVLLMATALLIVLLLYAKVGSWVMETMTQLLHMQEQSAFEVIVALGISYYTFSLISYLADIYWHKDQAEHNFLRLLLFTIYFPKILQGPISRHKSLGPQLREPHKFNYREFCFGLQLMVWGYFKKMVIADRLAIFVNTVFGDIGSHTGSVLLVATAFSTIQLYCDFSGCMDIARGFSQMLGLKLESNFDHPFFSKSAAEFWRRWHITLGTWFKDYIYMPLMISPRLINVSKKIHKKAGTRVGKTFMTVVPLTAVWLLTGLWHGTGWNYVLWGIYWGTIIILSNVFAPELKKLTGFLHINTDAGSWKLLQMVRTFVIFMVSRIIVLPGNLKVSTDIFRRILSDFGVYSLVDGSLYTLGLDRPNFILALVCVFILWSVSMLQRKWSIRERIAESNIVFRWAIYYIAFFSIVIFGIYGPGYNAADFIYMNF